MADALVYLSADLDLRVIIVGECASVQDGLLHTTVAAKLASWTTPAAMPKAVAGSIVEASHSARSVQRTVVEAMC